MFRESHWKSYWIEFPDEPMYEELHVSSRCGFGDHRCSKGISRSFLGSEKQSRRRGEPLQTADRVAGDEAACLSCPTFVPRTGYSIKPRHAGDGFHGRGNAVAFRTGDSKRG